MRYLSLQNILSLYSRVIETSGGLAGIRDQAAIESALSQPMMTFGGEELYSSPTLKALSRRMSFSKLQAGK